MRKTLIFSILTTSIFISSQELNQEYLDSLPDDIKEDILSRVDAKAEQEKKVYRSIDAPSEVEKFRPRVQMNDDRDLFGFDFFDTGWYWDKKHKCHVSKHNLLLEKIWFYKKINEGAIDKLD